MKPMTGLSMTLAALVAIEPPRSIASLIRNLCAKIRRWARLAGNWALMPCGLDSVVLRQDSWGASSAWCLTVRHVLVRRCCWLWWRGLATARVQRRCLRVHGRGKGPGSAARPRWFNSDRVLPRNPAPRAVDRSHSPPAT
jgi:hypothetical protein